MMEVFHQKQAISLSPSLSDIFTPVVFVKLPLVPFCINYFEGFEGLHLQMGKDDDTEPQKNLIKMLKQR